MAFTVADKMIIADPCQIDQRMSDHDSGSVATISNCAGEWIAEVETDADGIIALTAIRQGPRGQLIQDLDVRECDIGTASLFMGCASNVPIDAIQVTSQHQPGSFLAVAASVVIFFDRNGWAAIHVWRDDGRAAEVTVFRPDYEILG